MDVAALAKDLVDEHAALDDRVADLGDEGWSKPTPAAGWDVRDSISHLCFFDESARLALVDPDAFAAHTEQLLATLGTGPDVALGRTMTGQELLGRWRDSRAALVEAVGAESADGGGRRVPWYGPAMSLASFVTARIMETWAHGQDVADAIGASPVVSDRLRHVVHIGVGARRYAYGVHEVEDPGDPIRVEVSAPSGDLWTWGPDDAANRVSGTALDLAMLVTQRRHRDDTRLDVVGPVAEQWVGIAQSFAGPAGPGRAAGLGRAGD
jgi:uncharacterized protein (TIGR03084 family)